MLDVAEEVKLGGEEVVLGVCVNLDCEWVLVVVNCV